jgi:carbamoyltransferase
MKAILGLNAYHADSSACIVVDGRLVACVEEERFRRVKHWCGFPSESIRYCLQASNIRLDQLSQIAINTNPASNRRHKIKYTLSHLPSYSLLFDKLTIRRRRSQIREQLMASFPTQKLTASIVPVEHHLAHIASAYYAAPYDDAIAISVDGFGDFVSSAWAQVKNGIIGPLKQVGFPHSMGIFYQAITQFLGFPNYGDEYKVMGLASYGQPDYVDEMTDIVKLVRGGKFELNLVYFRHCRESIESISSEGEPVYRKLYTDALERLLGASRKPHETIEQRHKNIASSAQRMYELALFHLLTFVHRQGGSENLVLAGGCALNSVANGKIPDNVPFKEIYVPSAANDAGGAIGAAFVAAARDRSVVTPWGQMPHAAWGPRFDDDEIADMLSSKQQAFSESGCEVTRLEGEELLCATVAKAIADGLVVGWFQGRMEWGPRALGHRSILADPRRADMKEVLNVKIKRRESFRPFAPSILRERVSEWFERDDDVPFMMKVLQIRHSKREVIPAVTHVDGSGRVHTVDPDGNPLFYKLISAFERLTGVPVLLNTSFNENEPIVCKPEEALDCFMRTNMDLLVLGSHLVRRPSLRGE